MRSTITRRAEALDWRKKRSTYWTADGRMSEGLLRAREPFRARNALTGLAIIGFVGGVYAYSIAAVKQDDFSDVPLPSAEERARIEKEIEEERQKARPRASAPGAGAGGTVGGAAKGGGAVQGRPADAPPDTQLPSMGILGSVAFLSGPVDTDAVTSSTGLNGLVKGAPPVDRLGTSKDRSTTPGQPRQV